MIGKASFDEKSLAENYGAALDEILRAKPSSSKGRYLKKVVVSTTTGPGIPVDPAVTRNFTGTDVVSPGPHATRNPAPSGAGFLALCSLLECSSVTAATNPAEPPPPPTTDQRPGPEDRRRIPHITPMWWPRSTPAAT